MNLLFLRIVAVALLGTTFAGAGTMCRLPGAAHPAMAGCHHPERVPSHPQPADYRCCMSRHHSALLTKGFSVRPATQSLDAANAIRVVMVAGDSGVVQVSSAPSGGPPGVPTLRI